jgi:hypothetical protein|tara:strand:- start:791 stop:1327 length:537 start_codon:yes stop_codon:yes gene_type:complete
MENVKVRVEGVAEVMRKLRKLDDRLKKRILKKVGKKSLPPMVDSYKRNITDADEVFKVYRNGKIAYEIKPGQLRRSVGIKTPKHLQKKDVVGMSVGPRRSGRYKDAEKGGWYAGMINFGWLRVGGNQGKRYQGQNLNFAQKAMAAAKTRVNVRFVRVFRTETTREINKLKFGQRFGLR